MAATRAPTFAANCGSAVDGIALRQVDADDDAAGRAIGFIGVADGRDRKAIVRRIDRHRATPDQRHRRGYSQHELHVAF